MHIILIQLLYTTCTVYTCVHNILYKMYKKDIICTYTSHYTYNGVPNGSAPVQGAMEDGAKAQFQQLIQVIFIDMYELPALRAYLSVNVS